MPGCRAYPDISSSLYCRSARKFRVRKHDQKGAQPVARFRHKPGEQTEIADTGAATEDLVMKVEMPTGATAPVGNIYTAKSQKLRPLCSRSFWLP